MTNHLERQPGRDNDSNRVCLTCGGRGALRQGDEIYRTCLECLGQGRLPSLAAGTTMAALLNKGSVLQQPSGCRSGEQAVTDAVTSASR